MEWRFACLISFFEIYPFIRQDASPNSSCPQSRSLAVNVETVARLRAKVDTFCGSSVLVRRKAPGLVACVYSAPRFPAARFTVYAGFLLFELPCFVEYNRQVFGEAGEITVRGEYGELPTDGYGTDQEVRVGALNSFRTASVEELRRHNVVGRFQGNVRKCRDVFLQFLELRILA